MSRSLCCTVKSRCCGAYLFFVRMSLGGGIETSGQGTLRHFPGRVTKAALLDLQQGKHITQFKTPFEHIRVCAA